MNRKELVTAVAEAADLEQKTVDAVLRALQSTLEGAAASGEKVSVPGFFALSVGRREEREGRNPATGATHHHPGREHGQAHRRQRPEGSCQQVRPTTRKGPVHATAGPSSCSSGRRRGRRRLGVGVDDADGDGDGDGATTTARRGRSTTASATASSTATARALVRRRDRALNSVDSDRVDLLAVDEDRRRAGHAALGRVVGQRLHQRLVLLRRHAVVNVVTSAASAPRLVLRQRDQLLIGRPGRPLGRLHLFAR